jgi:hypothetical protein
LKVSVWIHNKGVHQEDVVVQMIAQRSNKAGMGLHDVRSQQGCSL